MLIKNNVVSLYMKGAARDIRDLIVHVDVTDNMHRHTTSGSKDSSDSATVLQNRTPNNNCRSYSKSAVIEQHLRDAILPHDLNRNWNSTKVSTYNVDRECVMDNVLEPLSEMRETTATSVSKSADSNNNSRTYSDSIASNSPADQLHCRIPVSWRTTSAIPRRMVTTGTQTMNAGAGMKQWRKTSRTLAAREVATALFRHRPEVVSTPRDDKVSAADRVTNYSGFYERDLEEILESAGEAGWRHLDRRRRRNTEDEFYFRLPRSPEVQSHRVSSDGCSSGSSGSDSELQCRWTSDDELNTDEVTMTLSCTVSGISTRLRADFGSPTVSRMFDAR